MKIEYDNHNSEPQYVWTLENLPTKSFVMTRGEGQSPMLIIANKVHLSDCTRYTGYNIDTGLVLPFTAHELVDELNLLKNSNVRKVTIRGEVSVTLDGSDTERHYQKCVDELMAQEEPFFLLAGGEGLISLFVKRSVGEFDIHPLNGKKSMRIKQKGVISWIEKGHYQQLTNMHIRISDEVIFPESVSAEIN